MPVSIVVGGQFGSEGKGKIALEIARRSVEPVTVVRVGGSNSGHTSYDKRGQRWALRQMPAASVDRDVNVVFPAGFFIDVDLFLKEVEQLNYPRERIKISENARLVTADHKEWERSAGLTSHIGSTGSGVGGAVMAATARTAANFALSSPRAAHEEVLKPFLTDAVYLLRDQLLDGHRVIVEGTQGYGLSLLESGNWPHVTSRYTSASGALAESGLSPMDVDDVTLVLRAYPIRVAGNSGPLRDETSWEEIARQLGTATDLSEYTTVTQKLRRVGAFDVEAAGRAIAANSPTRLVLNHLDYVGAESSTRVRGFVAEIERGLGCNFHWLGFSPRDIQPAWRRAA